MKSKKYKTTKSDEDFLRLLMGRTTRSVSSSPKKLSLVMEECGSPPTPTVNRSDSAERIPKPSDSLQDLIMEAEDPIFLIGDDGDDVDVLKPSEPEKVLDSSGSEWETDENDSSSSDEEEEEEEEEVERSMVPSRPRKSSDVVQSSKPRSRAKSSKRVSTASKSAKSVSNVSPSVSRITPSRPRVSSDSVPMSKPRVRTLSSKRLSVQSSPVPSDVLLDVLIRVPSSLAPDSARRGSALLTASRPTSTSMTEQSHSVLAPSVSTNIEGTPALVPDLAQHGSERVTASRPTSLSVTEQSHAPTVSVPVNTTEKVLVPDLARRGSSHLTASRPTSTSISSTATTFKITASTPFLVSSTPSLSQPLAASTDNTVHDKLRPSVRHESIHRVVPSNIDTSESVRDSVTTTENILVPDLARRGSSHLTASRPTSTSISSTSTSFKVTASTPFLVSSTPSLSQPLAASTDNTVHDKSRPSVRHESVHRVVPSNIDTHALEEKPSRLRDSSTGQHRASVVSSSVPSPRFGKSNGVTRSSHHSHSSLSVESSPSRLSSSLDALRRASTIPEAASPSSFSTAPTQSPLIAECT